MALVYGAETKLLRRCFFDVQNGVGLGRREEAYHRGCVNWLTAAGVPVQSKVRHPLRMRDTTVHTLIPDLVVWDKVVVEIKALPRALDDTDAVQLFDYLKVRSSPLGLLANFGLPRVKAKRFLYSPPTPLLTENWDAWQDTITDPARSTGVAARRAVRAMHTEHGTGYGEEATGRLLLHSLRRAGLSLELSPVAPAMFRDEVIDRSPLDCMVVDNHVMLTWTALFADNSLAFLRGQAYLSALGLEWGIAVNFGKKELQVTALRRAVPATPPP